jgi:hypothetical protein
MIDAQPERPDAGPRSRPLQDAFVELNIATAVRERTRPNSPEYVAALQRERAAAERVEALIDPSPPTP